MDGDVQKPDEAIFQKAMEVARLVFGGVREGTPQWNTCIQVARAMSGEAVVDIDPGRYSRASLAFQKCGEFNRNHPLKTDGVVKRGNMRIKTRVDQPAMVFADPLQGEIVMAYFHLQGWLPISLFSVENVELATADELMALGVQARSNGKLEIAKYVFLGALIADPTNWRCMNELAVLYGSQNEFDNALKYYNAALALEPNSAETLHNRSTILRAVGRIDEAITDAKKAAMLQPGYEMIRLNLGNCLDDAGRSAEMLEILDAQIMRQPNDQDAHYNRALTLLSLQRFEEGWPEFEWRLMQPMQNAHYEHYKVPRYDGSDLSGKSVLVWNEQGLGDEIMSGTMIPDLIASGAKVTWLVEERLVPVMRRAFPQITVDVRLNNVMLDLFRREPLRPEFLPRAVREGTFDFQMSQSDLGNKFRHHVDNFPFRAGFLFADREKQIDMRERLSAIVPKGNRIVGISWHSGRNSRVGHQKSPGLEKMVPILKIPGVTFINLQYGDTTADRDRLKREHGISILGFEDVNPLENMDDFFTLVSCMELVISVSNTTVHVAGALHVPCWVIVPEGPARFWYWHRNDERSPWYASLRLYRQPHTADWTTPINKIAATLAERV